MTWIIDDNGTRWVEPVHRPRRASGRALRFAGLKTGDQIMLKPQAKHYRKAPLYYLVTDLWFDPVAGQDDEVAGRMVAYVQLKADGTPLTRKLSTTLRGLASQQFHYADIDYIAHCKARTEQVAEGKVVAIGHANTIRKRPKLSGL